MPAPGRLRMVVIDAEGEAAAHALETALKLLQDREGRGTAVVATHPPATKPAAPAKPAAAPKAIPEAPPKKVAPNGKVMSGGVAHETVDVAGRAIALPPRQAELAGLLVKASPNPVAREFLAKHMRLGGAFAEQQIASIAADLRRNCEPHGIVIKTVRGVGIALQEAEAA